MSGIMVFLENRTEQIFYVNYTVSSRSNTRTCVFRITLCMYGKVFFKPIHHALTHVLYSAVVW